MDNVKIRTEASITFWRDRKVPEWVEENFSEHIEVAYAVLSRACEKWPEIGKILGAETVMGE
jgi:hypothetical protein